MIRKYKGEYITETFHQHPVEPAAHRRLYGAVRGHWRWSGRPATRGWSAAFRAGCSGAPSLIDFVRAVAHPVLESTGATFAGSQDAVDERVLLPVPIFARVNRGPYNFSYDSRIEYPLLDGSVCEQKSVVCVQISGNPRKTIFGQIIRERRLFQATQSNSGVGIVQNFFEQSTNIVLICHGPDLYIDIETPCLSSDPRHYTRQMI